jgi:hypothetical protein
MAAVGRPRRFLVRIERVVLGVGMAVVAFVLERRVLKAIKKKATAPAEGGRPPGPA